MATSSETTTLLSHAAQTNSNGTTIQSTLHNYDTVPAAEQPDDADKFVETSWQKETKLLAQYSAPLVVTYVLQYSYTFVIVIVSGRLGTNELAAASLATMTANITGLAIFEGLATSLDTLTSQAFGAGKKHMVGLHIQRMIALVLLTSIAIGAVWICSPWILEKIVPDRLVAHLAGDFLRFYLVGLPGYGIFEALKRFTQAQGDFVGPLLTAMICAPLNVFFNWLVVFRLNAGFRGAAIAVSITNSIQPLVFLLYINFMARDALQCWPGFEAKRAFTNWTPMIQLAVPGVIVILAEWLAFDILTLASSYLGTVSLAAQSVVMTISVLMVHIPFPTAIAASTRFGNLIGLGDLAAAKVAWKTHYVVFVWIGIFNVALLTACRHVIAQAFTRDPRVREIIVGVIPIVAAAQLFDAMCAIANGLTRGLGRQKISAWVNTLVYYLFALPLSFGLTFGSPHLGLTGLWIGPLIGLGLTAFCMTMYMRTYDWQKAVVQARGREE